MKKLSGQTSTRTNQKILRRKKTSQSHVKSVGKRNQARRDSKNR
jgi:hypothetical protein